MIYIVISGMEHNEVIGETMRVNFNKIHDMHTGNGVENETMAVQIPPSTSTITDY